MKNEKYIVFDIETTGLNPLDSRITCICAKRSDGESYNGCHTNERGLIKDFLKWIDLTYDDFFISANGRDFDIPFIHIRAFLNNISLKEIKWINRAKHFDVINDITDKRISLNNLARVYGLKLKSGDGKNAIKLFEDGKFDDLIDYCMDDVELTEKVYLKYLMNLEYSEDEVE